MKKLIATGALLLGVPTLASAQNADNPYRAEGYFFIAPIVSNTRDSFNPAYYGVVFPDGEPLPANFFLHVVGGVNTGFGGEVFVSTGLGLGAEVGYAGPDWSFSGGGAVGMVSPDVSYHFFQKKNRRRADPFATGGYSLYFGDRAATQNGFNVGGRRGGQTSCRALGGPEPGQHQLLPQFIYALRRLSRRYDV